jgi:hypothetical protein
MVSSAVMFSINVIEPEAATPPTIIAAPAAPPVNTSPISPVVAIVHFFPKLFCARIVRQLFIPKSSTKNGGAA